jgi:hypothetical protein
MKTVCAWCQAVLCDGPEYDDVVVTHGICLTCYETQMKEVEVYARQKQ